MNPNNQAPNAILALPPGFQFYPSEEQLLCFYLTSKNNSVNNNNNNINPEYANLYAYNVIKELDVGSYDPFDLPRSACFAYGREGRKQHWYCYTARVLNESGWRARGGFWLPSGRVQNVMSRAGNVVLGTKTSFVFYLGNSLNDAVRTDWVMNEYALVHQAQASFVLCRVFVKSRGGNSISDNGSSSSALDDQVTTRPVAIAGFHIPLSIPQVRTSRLTDGNMIDEDFLVRSMVEEDFIELDDLDILKLDDLSKLDDFSQ